MDYDGHQFCGTIVQATGPLAKWPGENPRLPHCLDVSGYRGSLTREAVRTAYARAWGYWAEHVEITPVEVDALADAWIRATFGHIDGGSGVLAWSYLADNTNSPKKQLYDSGESWVIVNPERPTSGIDLVRVACHEIGHVLGLDHDGSNADALMRPSYSTSIPKPTARDIQRLVGLGYRKRTTPPVPPPPAVPDPPPLDPGTPAPGRVIEVRLTDTRLVIEAPPGWTLKRVT